MELVKHQKSLPVKNFDDNVKPKIGKHGELFPDCLRALVCGKSNSGKTNAVFAMITHPNGLKYENLYICSKSLNQPKYIKLREIFSGIKEIGYYEFSSKDEIPENINSNSVFIFDDVVLEKQDRVRELFCFGRHMGSTNVIFISQSYISINKHLLRENSNFLVIFRMDTVNLKHIYDEHCYGLTSWDRFQKMCHACWKERFGFISIDLESNTFRKNFDEVFVNNEEGDIL